MAIAGDDNLSAGVLGAFKDAVVRIVLEYCQSSVWFYHPGDPGDVPESLFDPFILPPKLSMEDCRRLGQDGHRSVHLPLVFHS